jgi:hypothetical protein
MIGKRLGSLYFATMYVGDVMSSDLPSKRKVGSPEKYTDKQLVELTKDYISDGYRVNDLFPNIAGLALWLKLNRTTIYERAKECKEFSNTLESLKDLMEQNITKNALEGKYNANFATFLCKSRLGMKENDVPQTQQVNIQVVTNGEQQPMIQVG